MVTADFVWAKSIDDSQQGGVDKFYNAGVSLNHRGDWIMVHGMNVASLRAEGTYGSIIRVVHAFETGDIEGLPEDYVLELKPGQTHKVMNTQSDKVDYNVKAYADGPLYEAGVYQGYTTDVVPPDENGNGEEAAVYGPIMTRLMAFPFMQRFAGGREMSLKAGPRTGSGLPSKPIPTTIIPRVIIPRVASPPQTAPPPRRNGHPGGKTRKGGR